MDADARAEAPGSLEKIGDLARKIKAAADTARRSKKACQEIAYRADRVLALAEWLAADPEAAKRSPLRPALENLDMTLRRANYWLTEACREEKSFACLICCFPVWNLGKHLRQVHKDIKEHISTANFGSTMMIHTGNGQAATKVSGEERAPSSRDKDEFESFHFSTLEAATHNFSDEIGRGAFATVYKGLLPNGDEVAVKKFNNTHREEPQLEQYFNVYSALKPHPNVVRFLGYCLETRNEMVYLNGKNTLVETLWTMVVEEYLPNRTLAYFIENAWNKLEWPTSYKIIQGIVQGVAHLHARDVIHMDLRPDNILLDSYMNPKIGDFGLSKIMKCDEEVITDQIMGSVQGHRSYFRYLNSSSIDFSLILISSSRGYMAPEFVRTGIASAHNDIYGFGVMLLKIIGATMVEPGFDRAEWVKVHGSEGINGLFERSFPEKSHLEQAEIEQIKRCMEIGLLCTDQDRGRRPSSMKEILDALNGDQMLLTRKHNDQDTGSEKNDPPCSNSKKNDPLSPPPRVFSFDELEKATDNFSTVISTSHAATLYRGLLRDNNGLLVVAIKKFCRPWGNQSLTRYDRVSSVLHKHKYEDPVSGILQRQRRRGNGG